MNRFRVISDGSPYVSGRLHIYGQPTALDLEMLIDTGFDGQVLLPAALIPPEA